MPVLYYDVQVIVINKLTPDDPDRRALHVQSPAPDGAIFALNWPRIAQILRRDAGGGTRCANLADFTYSGAQAVLLDLVMQRPHADTQNSGGFLPVGGHVRQRVFD